MFKCEINCQKNSFLKLYLKNRSVIKQYFYASKSIIIATIAFRPIRHMHFDFLKTQRTAEKRQEI